MKILLLAASLILVAHTASAQESGQAGVTLGTNALRAVFNLNDTIAIRPEGTFSFSTGDSIDSSGWGLGTSVLFYMHRVEKLSTYFAPRFLYQRNTTSGPSLLDITTSIYDVSGSFGAQYALHRRFSVYGEVGLLIRDTTASGTLLSGTSTTSVRPLTGFGGVLYFK